MKKIITTLIVLSLFSFFAPKFFANKVFAAEPVFAKITKTNVALYSQPVVIKENVLFYLEVSYFVRLLENEKNGFYKCEYIDQIGYVLASDLIFVKGAPQRPYASNVGFRVFAFEGLHMRSTPIRSQGHFNIITTLNFLESNLTYYGKASGEIPIPDKTDVWYFAKYTNPITKEEFKGYVYSIFCDNLSTIAINTEILEEIEKPIFEVPKTDKTQSDKFSALPKELQIIIVLGVSLPCLALIYFLFKPTKISLDVGKNKVKKIKRIKNADYYEFED
jgi:hypothetical protein